MILLFLWTFDSLYHFFFLPDIPSNFLCLFLCQLHQSGYYHLKLPESLISLTKKKKFHQMNHVKVLLIIYLIYGSISFVISCFFLKKQKKVYYTNKRNCLNKMLTEKSPLMPLYIPNPIKFYQWIEIMITCSLGI